ncbi:MAG: hypothetical protein ACLFV4_09875 [Candidatus Hydrogenedentota bacterium]
MTDQLPIAQLRALLERREELAQAPPNAEEASGQRERVERQLAAVRKNIRHEQERVRKRLQSLQQERAALGEQLASGEIDSSEANERGRIIHREAQACAEAVELAETLLSAHTSRDVPASTPPPAPSKARKKSEPGAAWPGAVSWERLPAVRSVTGTAAVLTSLCVFLGWLRLPNAVQAASLFHALASLGSDLTPPAGAYTLWSLLFLIPLLGFAVSLAERHGAAAGSVMVCGGAAMLFAALHIVLGSLLGTSAAAVQPGPLLYLLGGAVIVLCAQWRLAFAGRRSLAWGKRAVALLVVHAVLAGGAVAFHGFHQGPVTQVEAAFTPDAGAGIIRTSLHNTGREETAVFAPWPDGRPHAQAPVNSVGYAVLVREEAGEDFRLFPGSHPAWTVQTHPVLEDGSFYVSPGSEAVAELELDALMQAGVSPRAIRIELTHRTGREMASFAAEISIE